jgi:hypothetical protein
MSLTNRMCKSLIGLKSTGKSTLLKTCCVLVSLLFEKTVPIYVDYRVGCSKIHPLFLLACEIRGQMNTEVRQVWCNFVCLLNSLSLLVEMNFRNFGKLMLRMTVCKFKWPKSFIPFQIKTR